MIIKPKIRGFICTTAHPVGCFKNVEDMVNAALKIKDKHGNGPKNVIVIGSSSGYGLASRVVSAFCYDAKTIGVSFERESSENRTATAGFYNNLAFESISKKYNIPTKTINGDAFSNEVKDEVVSASRDLFGGEKVDLLIYSLASPKRHDPNLNVTYSSVLKPIGASYESKTVDFHTGVVSDILIEPANDEEILETIKVMGGEDFNMWIDKLIKEDLIADGFKTIAYSYIGSPLTHPIYKDGTIGKAKDDLLNFSCKINEKLKNYNGGAFISINKALVTQASSAIPVVPLYISLLYEIMKKNGTHEGCFEQIERLFRDKLYSGKDNFFDEKNRIRMDDYEMKADVQNKIERLWPLIRSENVETLTDIKGYKREFYSLFGFGRDDVDYDEDIKEF
ncbi:MAG: trans-2-enoyl-CoA reductase family protein [Oscillospiraceae bacterium]|nr:trans-2-enoyl-CoA reductase family protein [Oscillospiraceae bacterium]